MEIEEIVNKIVELDDQRKIGELHSFLEDVNSADFPAIFEEIKSERIIMVYRLLSKEKAAEVFVELDHDRQEQLINLLTDKELRNIMNEIYMDDAADLVEEMPADVVKRILANTRSDNRKIINELLKYPEDTAGTLMTTEFIDLEENMTVKQAFDEIKQKGLRKETVYNCYVLAKDRTLLGVVDVQSLLISERDVLVKDIMDTNVIKVGTLEDQEEVVKMFDKYSCIAIPVVDKQDRLVGIITIDDAIDVMQEETMEDFEKMAAMKPTEDTYMKTSVFTHAKHRIFWLLFLMISAMITGGIIEHFENAIAALPLLVAFIPTIMGTGGNCGSQASTLIIRGLAMDEVTTKDCLRAMWKELKVGLLVGFGLAIIETGIIMIQYHDIKTALVISSTLVLTVVVSKQLGVLLPMGAQKIGWDPAIMAAPLLTTISDTCSVLMFFVIASSVLSL